MVKIGAKLVKNHKTIKQTQFVSIHNYDENDFYSYIVQIAKQLDIAAPIVIPYHRESYERFNSLKFDSSDFIDKIDFDYLYLENDDR